MSAMSSKGLLKVGVILATLLILAGGIAFLLPPHDWSKDVPRLVVTGDGSEYGQSVVAFRVVIPESRTSAGYAISKPQVINTNGRTQDVALIRFVTPAREAKLGFVEDGGGEYYLRLDVAYEEKGLAGWIHRVRNCWENKSLKPLREMTYEESVSIASDRITNAVVRRTGTQQ